YMVVAIQGGAEASFRYGAAHSFAGQFQATQGSSIITHLVEMAKDDVGRDVLAAFRASQA
ncbi:MAG: hypothetical protein ACRERC_11885, partial [Candidatus Binatia bacterium]